MSQYPKLQDNFRASPLFETQLVRPGKGSMISDQIQNLTMSTRHFAPGVSHLGRHSRSWPLTARQLLALGSAGLSCRARDATIGNFAVRHLRKTSELEAIQTKQRGRLRACRRLIGASNQVEANRRTTDDHLQARLGEYQVDCTQHIHVFSPAHPRCPCTLVSRVCFRLSGCCTQPATR